MNSGEKIILMDFKNDLLSIFTRELFSMGYKVPPNVDVRDIGIMYFNVLHRRITVTPRRVVEAREFVCLPEYEEAYNNFRTKSQKGDNLNPHLSSKLLDLNYNDHLLNDWGIHHFHLGTSPGQKGFVARTHALLFAWVDEENVFAIDIDGHGSWTKKKLVETIHENWPYLIDHSRMTYIIDISNDPTEDDIGQLRGAGLNSLLKLSDGSIYSSIGGGYTTSGDGLYAVESANRSIIDAKRLEEYIRNEIEDVVLKIKGSGAEIGARLEFHLLGWEGNAALVSELSSQRSIRIQLE